MAEINRLLKQYQQMRRLMRTARKGVRGLDLSELAPVRVRERRYDRPVFVYECAAFAAF